MFAELRSKRPTVRTNAILYQSGGIVLEHYPHSVDRALVSFRERQPASADAASIPIVH